MSEARGGSENECRDALGDDRFAALAAEVDVLPEKIDRSLVFSIVLQGEYMRSDFELLHPNDTNRIEKALDEIGQGINALERAIRDSKWADLTGNVRPDFVERVIGNLKREYRKLAEIEELGEGYVRVPPLRLSRKTLGWVPKPMGRPRADWKHETVDRLRKAGLTRGQAEAVAEAAGLMGGPTPIAGRNPEK